MELQNTRNIQDKKPLLQTNSITQPDNKDLIKNELYTAAKELDKRFDSSVLTTHRSLINFITLMNKAKRYNISEYNMARFAYTQNTIDTPIPLYFHCLEKYNNAQEELPFTTDELSDEFCLNSELARALNIKYTYQSMQDIENKIKRYPAYTNVINKLKIAAYRRNDDYRSNYQLNRILCRCLHEGTKILFNGYPQYDDVANFDNFYDNAYAYQHPSSDYNYYYVYSFIYLVAHIKNIEKETDEKKFFSKILDYQHKPKEFLIFKTHSNYSGREDFTFTSTKNRIALMYRCVEEYHRKQGDKITPTGGQHAAFLSFKKLDISLPNWFDTTLLSDNKYAFKQFETLTDDIAIIRSASDAALEQAVKKILHEI
jgi:hypothetical protein